MKTLRRYDIRPATCFLTVVTFERKPLLLRDASLFSSSWKQTVPIAWVLMPDHFHAFVPCCDSAISKIMDQFKLQYRCVFERQFGRGRIWQNRFWDHIIRDECDFNHHLDYIHFNPVKHGKVHVPSQYTYSSYAIWAAQGYYDEEWGALERLKFDGQYGE